MSSISARSRGLSVERSASLVQSVALRLGLTQWSGLVLLSWTCATTGRFAALRKLLFEFGRHLHCSRGCQYFVFGSGRCVVISAGGACSGVVSLYPCSLRQVLVQEACFGYLVSYCGGKLCATCATCDLWTIGSRAAKSAQSSLPRIWWIGGCTTGSNDLLLGRSRSSRVVSGLLFAGRWLVSAAVLGMVEAHAALLRQLPFASAAFGS